MTIFVLSLMAIGLLIGIFVVAVGTYLIAALMSEDDPPTLIRQRRER